MKNKLLLGALLIGTASLFTSCKDDNDSNPSLIQPTEFTLNTPAYSNETVDLIETEFLPLSWSQPKYTADNAPVNATYEVQVSPTNSFKVSTDEAEADEDGLLEADYAILTRTTQLCTYQLETGDLNKALVKVAKWSESAVPAEQDVYIRVRAYITEPLNRKHYPVASNSVKIKTAPYYVELKDAAPIMWYLVGDNFGNGSWSDNPGVGSFPMFIQYGYTYDKVTGGGEITYLNYFTMQGWKIQPADFNWDYGFMNGGEACKATYRNGGGDAGNIWCDPEGYYLVTVNTATNECTIEKQDITPAVYDQICIAGNFNQWGDADMTPVNKDGENHVWCYIMDVPAGETVEMKFKVAGTWDINWGFGAANGEVNTCGKGTNGGSNIGVPEGTWIIMFNDITGEFSIIAKK